METKRFNFPETVPLVQLENGAVRVRNSRVTLDTIVHKTQMGNSIARIHRGFPTVSVEQIKQILAWYFDNKAEADEYLREQEALSEEIRRRIQSTPEYQAWHSELLRRKAELRKN